MTVLERIEFVKALLCLWDEYATDKEVLHNPNIPPGFPVLSADGFIKWLQKKYQHVHKWREYKDEGHQVLCVCETKNCREYKIINSPVIGRVYKKPTYEKTQT